MLKNKIIVRKIRNIVILLMAIVIMIGAYKNIDRSRAEDVIELDAVALDNYGYLANERFKLEAKQIEDELYEIELPESINSKKINQIVKVTLEEIVPEVVSENAVKENAEVENTVDGTPVEERAVTENVTIETSIEENTAAENTTQETTETPAEESTTTERPTQEQPEISAEENTTTESAPTETPAETPAETPTEENPVEENAPVENAPVENTTPENTTPADTPTEEAPTEEAPTEEAPTEDTATENVIEETTTLEIVENKIYLTSEQVENKQVNIEVVYDIAILEKNEESGYDKTLLSEKTEEERTQLEATGIIGPTIEETENTKILYSKILKYEDEENGKLVELKGFLPIDAQLQVEKVEQEQLTEIFGESQSKIDVAYDIKIIRQIITQVPVDETNPESEMQEIIEIIEINPEEYGETCEVSIKDMDIEQNSQVYHVKEDNTVEQVNVKESNDGNISFEAEKFSIYAVSNDEIIVDEGIGTGLGPVTIRIDDWGYKEEADRLNNTTVTVGVDTPTFDPVLVYGYAYQATGVCVVKDGVHTCNALEWFNNGTASVWWGTYYISEIGTYTFYSYSSNGSTSEHNELSVTINVVVEEPPTISPGAVRDNLIREYDADNNTGTGHDSSITTWKDLSGNVDATITGGTFTSEITQPDEYLLLDGTDDWVNLGQVDLSNSATLEATITLDKAPTSDAIIMANYETGGAGLVMRAGGIPEFQVYIEEIGANVRASLGSALELGQRYHLLGTYDGVTVKFYVNGEQVATTAQSGTIQAPDDSTVMAIGVNAEGSSPVGQYLNMKVHSARVYNRALGPTEVAQNKRASIDYKTWEELHSEIKLWIRSSTYGLALGAELEWGLSQSNTTEPTEWYMAYSEGYEEGATNAKYFVGNVQGLTGKYFIWVKPDSVIDTDGHEQTETAVSTTRIYYDSTAPIWESSSPVPNFVNDNVSINLVGYDQHAGIENSSLEADDITVKIDGEVVDGISKILMKAPDVSEATYGEGAVSYRLTLGDLKEAIRETGSNYRNWSGTIEIILPQGALTDKAGNTSATTTISLGHIDTIEPEIRYVYSDGTISHDDQEVYIVFSITDKYFSESTLSVEDLTITVDGKNINDTDINAQFSSITEVGSGNGYTYTLQLTGLDQAKLAAGKSYADYSGIVTVAIPADKATDTKGNKNIAKTITVGIDILENTTTPYIPSGYSYVEGTLGTGYVIKDGNGNEYVWIEVPQTEEVYKTAGLGKNNFGSDSSLYSKIEFDLQQYTEAYRQGTKYSTDNIAENGTDTYYAGVGFESEAEYNEQKKKMLKSIYKNGGFYVGRYETGIGSDGSTPVIQKNKIPYTYITVSGAQDISSGFATSGNITSLMFGVQWDLILKNLTVKGVGTYGEIVNGSTNWGNYKDSAFEITNTSAQYWEDTLEDDESSSSEESWSSASSYEKQAESRVKLTTGSSEDFKRYNIYDLAGNVAEWTLEKNADVDGEGNTVTTLAVPRGGQYNTWGYYRPAGTRGYGTAEQANKLSGFRVALYKDEGTGDDAAETPEGEIVDVVKPIWTYKNMEIVQDSPNVGQMTVTFDVTATDKYLFSSDDTFNAYSLSSDVLKVVFRNGEQQTAQISTSDKAKITETVDGKTAIIGITYKVKVVTSISSQTQYLRIPEEALTDQYGNKCRPIDIPMEKTLHAKENSESGSQYTNQEWTKNNVYIYITDHPSEDVTSQKYSVYGIDESGNITSTIVNGKTTIGTGDPTVLTSTGRYKAVETIGWSSGETTTEEYIILIDKTAPTSGTLTMNKANGTSYTNDSWTNQNVSIYANIGTDDHSGPNAATYSVNGGSPIDAATVTELTEGTYTITVTTEDNVGNTATSPEYTVKIEKVKPTITVTPTNTSSDWYNEEVAVTIKAEDTGGSQLTSNTTYYQYYLSKLSDSLYGGSLQSYTNGVAVKLNPGTTGKYYLFVRQMTDNAGNLSELNGTLTETSEGTFHMCGEYWFDYTPATTTSVEIKNVSKDGYDVYVYGVEDGHSGVSKVEVKTGLENGQSTVGTATNQGSKTWYYNVNVSQEGWYNTVVYIYDNALNTPNCKTITPDLIYVDRTAPTITLNPEKNETNKKEHSTQVTIKDVATVDPSQASGLANSGSVKYGWAKVEDNGTITAPSSYTTVQVADYYDSTTKTMTFTASTPPASDLTFVTADYYLWVVPNGIEDLHGNTLTTTKKSDGIFRVDKDVPTLTVAADSCDWRNTPLTVTITAEDVGKSPQLASGNVYEYYLSSSATALSDGSWKSYKTTATSTKVTGSATINPGKSGMYYLFVKQVQDIAGNISETNGTSTTIGSATYQRFGPYRFDYDDPTWKYDSKKIYYSEPEPTPSDVGNNDYANRERTVIIRFTGQDAYIEDGGNNKVTTTLTADAIKVYVDGTEITSLSKKELTTSGSGTELVTGTLKIKGITGNGALTVVIPKENLKDVAGNLNGSDASISTTIEPDIVIDNTNPNLVLEVESPATGAYKAGQTITITATYNENIYDEVTSNTLINTKEKANQYLPMTLAFGGVTAKGGNATCTSFNANVFTYTYTIQSGDNGKLTVSSFDTVYDRAGNSITSTTLTGYTIHADTEKPTMSVTPTSHDWTNLKTIKKVSVTITHDDPKVNNYASGVASTTGKYFLSTSQNPSSVGTLSSYTSGTAFEIKPTTSGQYYLFVQAINDKATNTTTGTNVTVGGVTYHRYGPYKFDYTAPKNIDDSGNDVLQMRLNSVTGASISSGQRTRFDVYVYTNTGTDDHSGPLSTTYTIIKDKGDATYEEVIVENKAAGSANYTVLGETGTYTITVTTKDSVIDTQKNEVTSTYTVIVDKDVPQISASPASTSTYYKDPISVALTAEDVGRNPQLDFDSVQLQYFVSSTNQEGSLTTGTWTKVNDAKGTATIPINPGVSGEYHLYIKRISDTVGNPSDKNGVLVGTVSGSTELVEQDLESAEYHKFGPYYFDYDTPTITIETNSNNTWSKTHSTKVYVRDALTELAANQKVRYGWSTSTTKAPSSYTTVDLSTNAEGTTMYERYFTAEGSDISGKYYLWVEPYTSVKDTSVSGGNSLTTAEQSTGTFWFDNTAPDAPTITNSSGGNWAYQAVTITAKSKDPDPGSGLNQILYSWDQSTWSTDWNVDSSIDSAGTAGNTGTVQSKFSDEMDKTLYVKAVDKLGNESEIRSTPIRIDTTDPKWTYVTKDIYYKNDANDVGGNNQYMNDERTAKIVIKGTDPNTSISAGPVTSSLDASDITVKVNGTDVTSKVTINPIETTGNGTTEVTCTITIENISGNGALSVTIPSGTLTDQTLLENQTLTNQNTNTAKTLSTDLDITIDNTDPKLLQVSTNILTANEYNNNNNTEMILVALYDDKIYTDKYVKNVIDEKTDAPIMTVKFLNSSGQLVAGKGTISCSGVAYDSAKNRTRITYKYIIDGDLGDARVSLPAVYDIAGNPISATNVPPILNVNVEVTKPTQNDYYRAGQVVTLKATYAGSIYDSSGTQITKATAPKLKVKFGSVTGKGNSGYATCESVDDNIIIYEYTITANDNGKLFVENLSTVYDEEEFAIDLNNLLVSSLYKVTADTTAPTNEALTNSSEGRAAEYDYWTNQDVTITAKYKDTNPQPSSGSGIQKIEYSLDQSSWSTSWDVDSNIDSSGTAPNVGTVQHKFEDEMNETFYVRAADKAIIKTDTGTDTTTDTTGNISTVLSTPVKIDKKNPTATINPTSGSGTIKKEHSVTIAIADNNSSNGCNSGLQQGTVLKYGWSKSNTTAPTYTDAEIVYSTGSTTGASLTVATPNETGIWYLWVYANVSDRAGNTITETITSEEFLVDVTAPTVSLSQTSNTTWAQSHTVKVTLADNGTDPWSGLDNEKIEVKYGWSTSKTTAPTYTTATLEYDTKENEKYPSAFFNAVTPSETGKFYLWVVPTNVIDIVGNQKETTPIITDDFWVDVTPPEWTVEVESKSNPTVELSIIGTDADS